MPVISMKKPDLYNHAERKSWQENKSEKMLQYELIIVTQRADCLRQCFRQGVEFLSLTANIFCVNHNRCILFFCRHE